MPRNLWVTTYWAYGLVAASFQLTDTPLAPFVTPIRTAAAAAVMVYLSGAHIIAVIEKKRQQTFEPWTFTALALLYSLFIPPLILFGLYIQLSYISPALALWAYGLWPLVHAAVRLPQLPPSRRRRGTVLAHPAVWAAVLIIIIHGITTTRFSFIPAPDTYSWLIKYENTIPKGQLPTESVVHRQAYAAFIAAAYYFTALPLYTLLKYVLPYLAVTVVVPLWLLARQVPGKALQLVILLVPIAMPALITEFDISRQQTFVLLFLLFAVGITSETVRTKKSLPAILLAMPAAAGYFIHPVFRFFYIITIAGLSLVGWRRAPAAMRTSAAAAVLLLLFVPHLRPTAVNQMYEQGRAATVNVLRGRWNLRFPAHYTNSDGYEMSWPGAAGIAKYYAYYASPLMLVLLGGGAIFLIRRPALCRAEGRLYYTAAMAPLAAAAAVFLGIAEFAPRFGNIAYLPERAWPFFSIVALPFSIPLLRRLRYPERVGRILLVAVVLGTAGGIYVTALTAHTIPEYELRAAAWMRESLPDNAEVFSSSSRNVIRYHARKEYVGLPVELYSEAHPEPILERLAINRGLSRPAGPAVQKMADYWGNISAAARRQQDAALTQLANGETTASYLQTIITSTNGIRENLTTIEENQQEALRVTQRTIALPASPPTYIYYAATDPANPYITRPYAASFTGSRQETKFPALDGTPEYFQLVYADGLRVRIWRVRNTQPAQP
ncbi:MAG: hypothetical protein COT71_01730 [Candidatus Andersenbacteria bacterium CG10_big_fil_rev_8_21_14_0_10_54_11]|uniref:Glycosyltransferase RgtA/B/C/D-like domain-containing protein n=1 Tax=Candidatus Andersenbacteria bacterium CG10_big_fil_rev_8_21_14_0_10_54_11 TaxID=1974485 RepID=A0A2M6WZQ7_9BACT|nr:MAG: hypothetical protein COT71_01730 [Candidatus Andersenbacteria bacterium CG10_big_fil_rev_8_21_14_0_10_54_11]